MLTDAELLALNARGFIPGPDESEERFIARTRRPAASLPRAQIEWAREQLLELFDFAPDSLNVVYSNKNLRIWEGAACWIEDGACTLQLREGFRKGTYLFGLYSRDELLAHEAVHAARAMFEEPENEEFFAYATSPKRWRRVLGPLVRRPWELWVWALALGFGIVWSGAFVVALGLFAYATWRLARQHARRARAAATLAKQLATPRLIRAALFRTTDSEIRALAKGKLLEADDSLRWRLLKLAYFTANSRTP